MNKIVSIFFFAFVLTNALSAQTKTTANQKATATASAFKNLKDSASYALGLNIAQSLNTEFIAELNTKIILQGLQDVFDNKTTLLNDSTAYVLLSTYSEKIKEEKDKKFINEGVAFLEKNKTKPGIKTTASGLQYEILKEGSGEKPGENDSVTVNYKGTLLDGTEFDNSYERGEPLTIELGNVIKGWIEGVQLMSNGSKYKFYIPYELGYGLRGAPPTIPGGSTLIFEIELLDVKKGQ
ncbi:MAG: FKBP-type peptidyl-prolyl cis-trans isomerase [Niabella sp.]